MGKGSTLRIDIIADGSKASKTMDAVGGKAGRFGKALAVGAAAGAAGVALAAGKIAVDSIKSASAVEQAYGATESVFGKYADKVKAADVAARLQAQGLDVLKGPAKAAAEAQATLALLTEQTTSAQGAFSRESGTAAGQQQRLTAQWENAKATLGQGLLPIVTSVATYLTSNVMPAVQGAAGTLAQKLGPALSQVAAFIRDKVVPAARTFIDWFQNKVAPGIRSAVTPVINGLRGAFASVQAAVERNKPQLEAIGRVLRTVAEFIASKVVPVVGRMLGDSFKVMGKALGFAIDLIGAMVDGVKGAVDWIRRLIDVAGSVGGAVKSGLGKLNPFGFMAAPAATATLAPTGPSSRMATLTATPQTLVGSPGSSSSSSPLAPIAVAPTVNNYWTLRVDGALDPIAVAEQISQLLRDQAKRTGRPMVAMA
jgi:hypothetical protein